MSTRRAELLISCSDRRDEARNTLQLSLCMTAAKTCAEIASLPCVFIVALGRTGSTHLLRILNAIPGYRVTGETDNAWIYLGWWQAAQGASAGLTPSPSRLRLSISTDGVSLIFR